MSRTTPVRIGIIVADERKVRGVFMRESAYRAGRSARAVLGQQLDPAAHGEGHGAAVLGILEHQLALIGPCLLYTSRCV